MHSLKLGLEIVEYYRGCVRPQRACAYLEKEWLNDCKSGQGHWL